MSTIRTATNDDLRTDACPSPPRDQQYREESENPKIHITSETFEEEINGQSNKQSESNQPLPEQKPNKSPKTGARAKTHSERKKKDFGRHTGNCSYNVLSVNNSNGVHFGNTYVYNGKEQDNSTPKATIYKSEEIIMAMDCSDLVERPHITYISTHVGEGWKNIGRLLDYSDGQIDQFHENHHISGVREVVYQMLLDWTRTQPKTATIGSAKKSFKAMANNNSALPSKMKPWFRAFIVNARAKARTSASGENYQHNVAIETTPIQCEDCIRTRKIKKLQTESLNGVDRIQFQSGYTV